MDFGYICNNILTKTPAGVFLYAKSLTLDGTNGMVTVTTTFETR